MSFTRTSSRSSSSSSSDEATYPMCAHNQLNHCADWTVCVVKDKYCMTLGEEQLPRERERERKTAVDDNINAQIKSSRVHAAAAAADTTTKPWVISASYMPRERT